MQEEKRKELNEKSKEIRILTLDMISDLGKGHVGGSMSIVDILAVLYYDKMKVDPANPKWDDRDRLVVSKGHSGPAVYATLAHKGFFPKDMLYTLNRPHTNLPSHCDMRLTPGIDQTTGSLAQGLSCAVGRALALKLSGNPAHVYCIVGDGELQEGQCWEAFMLAGNRGLDNLTVFCDRNHGQVDGTVEEIGDIEPLADKLTSFKFQVYDIDGHDIAAIGDTIDAAKADGKPSFIICNTIKARGVQEMEGKVESHNTAFSREQFEAAKRYIEETL